MRYPGDYGHPRRYTVAMIAAAAVVALLIAAKLPTFSERVRDGFELGFLLWLFIGSFVYAVLGIRYWRLPDLRTPLPNTTGHDNEARFHLFVIVVSSMFALTILMGILFAVTA